MAQVSQGQMGGLEALLAAAGATYRPNQISTNLIDPNLQVSHTFFLSLSFLPFLPLIPFRTSQIRPTPSLAYLTIQPSFPSYKGEGNRTDLLRSTHSF